MAFKAPDLFSIWRFIDLSAIQHLWLHCQLPRKRLLETNGAAYGQFLLTLSDLSLVSLLRVVLHEFRVVQYDLRFHAQFPLALIFSDRVVSFHGFVFSNCVIQAFEAILSANKITTEEARLVDELIQTYLCDDLLLALGEDYISVIHRLLMPFSEAVEAPQAKSKGSSDRKCQYH